MQPPNRVHGRGPKRAQKGGMETGRTVVCDTSVLLAGGDPRSGGDERVYITPGVVAEVRRREERERLETLLSTGLEVRSPGREALARVEEAAAATGDRERLSAADSELVALALELGAELLTDDRSMQNVAKQLEVAYRGFAQAEIGGMWRWQSTWRCKGCGKVYGDEPPGRECRVCGHEVVKKHRRVRGDGPPSAPP